MRVIVFSGDGGFNEALNGIERNDLPLGFVPGGGTSVLPRALGLPRDPVAAAEQLADALEANRFRRISTGRVNDRRFAFGAGIGIDAEVVRRIDDRGRSPDGTRPGDLAFVSTFARLLVEHRGRLEPMLEVEGFGRAAFLFVANVNVYSFLKAIAIKATPEAAFEQGLDFLAPVSVTPRTLPPLLYALATGRPARNALRGPRPRPDRGEDGPAAAASGRRRGSRRRDRGGLRSRARLDLGALLTFGARTRRIVRCGLFRHRLRR